MNQIKYIYNLKFKRFYKSWRINILRFVVLLFECISYEEFKTSKLIVALLSPVICQIHLNDPTFDIFIINTQEPGSFSHLLDLFNFKKNNIPDHELPFIQEVIEILVNQTIECEELDKPEELTVENVFSKIKYHEKHYKVFSARLEKEIEFISTHFTEIFDS